MLHNLLEWQHILMILVVGLLFFGPKKLPELGKGLGDGIRNFRDSMKQAVDTTKSVDTTEHSERP